MQNKLINVLFKVFYMKQTISNACGTVALMHSIANNTDVIKLKDGALKVSNKLI